MTTLSLPVLSPSKERCKLSSEGIGDNHRNPSGRAVARGTRLTARPSVTSPFAACRGRIQLGSPETSPTAEDDRVGYQGDAGIGRVGLLFSLIGPVQSISSRRLIQLRASARRRAGRFPVSGPFFGLGDCIACSSPNLGRRLRSTSSPALSIVIARVRTLPPEARNTAGVETHGCTPRLGVSAGQSFHDFARGLSDLLPVVAITHHALPHLNFSRRPLSCRTRPLRDVKLNTSVPLYADQSRRRGTDRWSIDQGRMIQS